MKIMYFDSVKNKTEMHIIIYYGKCWIFQTLYEI